MSEPPDARRALLRGLFDDAGLFPPASLTMAGAAAGHAASRSGPNAWMTTGFVCPASKLDALPLPDGAAAWRVSVILDSADAAAHMRAFEQRAGARARIEQAEGRPAATTKDAIDELIVRADGRPLFIEIPAGDPAAVEAVATHQGAGVKVRCGGEFVPSAAALAATIAACRDHGLRMKATAGLHHPYPSVGQHGFVNLAAAAIAAIAAGAGEDMLTAILNAAGPPALLLSRDELVACGLSLDAAACARRDHLLAGIGSCSFDEPVADLTALGILPL